MGKRPPGRPLEASEKTMMEDVGARGLTKNSPENVGSFSSPAECLLTSRR